MTFTRFVRQVVTPAAYPATATASATYAAFELLKAADWVETPNQNGGQYPTHAYAQAATLNADWDAFNICCAYNAGSQKVMAGYVAYRFTLPPAATRDGNKITSVQIRGVADKYNTTGARISAFTSNDSLPLTCGVEIRQNGFATLTGMMRSEYPADPGSTKNSSTNKSEILTLTPADPATAAKYLWVYITLEDYTAYRGSWVEGGAALIAETLTVNYDTALATGNTASIAPVPCALGTGFQLFEVHGHLFATHTGNRLSWFKNNAWYPINIPGSGITLTHLANGVLSLATTDEEPILLYRLTLSADQPLLTPIHISDPITAPRIPVAVSNGDIIFEAKLVNGLTTGYIVCYTIENQIFHARSSFSTNLMHLLAIDTTGNQITIFSFLSGLVMPCPFIRSTTGNSFTLGGEIEYTVEDLMTLSSSSRVKIMDVYTKTSRGVWFTDNGVFFVSGLTEYSQKSMIKCPEGLKYSNAYISGSTLYFVFRDSSIGSFYKIFKLTPSTTFSLDSSGFRIYTLTESDLIHPTCAFNNNGWVYPCDDLFVGFGGSDLTVKSYFIANEKEDIWRLDFDRTIDSRPEYVDLYRFVINSIPVLLVVEAPYQSSGFAYPRLMFAVNLTTGKLICSTYLPAGTQFSPATLTFFHENTRFPLVIS